MKIQQVLQYCVPRERVYPGVEGPELIPTLRQGRSQQGL